ncbi:hypothetical protein B0H11DRAFT_2167887 [Mycena galericulata]|nr:hypothetical protein B0H11DRAFT_2167887 [Mycena galericulata]
MADARNLAVDFGGRRFHPNPVSLTTLPATTTPSAKTNPTPDALFGPPIGPVPPAPAWTTAAAHTPKRLVDADELTPDTVRTWIEKSKLPSTPTTTLQAQVNLRRPTLRLAPLTDVRALGVHLKDAPHLLAFQFDCAAPQCGVHVHVLLPAAHPDAPAHGGPLRVFEAVVPGGFGRTLGAADGAVLELARFERMPAVASGAAGSVDAETDVGAAKTQGQGQTQAERKRFTPFHFRRRAANASAASAAGGGTGSAALPATGAPLAVVDANAPPAPEAAAAAHNGGKADAAGDDSGVRVTIRLVALDAQGKELEAPNEQTVYFVVGRLGAPHPPPPTTAATGDAPAEARTSSSEADEDKKSDTDAAEDAEDKDPDTRAWLVRVVRREATIGPHTFALHEIYGLGAGGAPAPADDPVERECLLCLSAAREVVLLPCRHLVACRPCAVNMVEFGAGGAIVAEAAAVEAEVVVEPVVEPVPVPEVPAVQGEGAVEGEGEGEAPAEGEVAAGATTTEPAAAPAAPTPTPAPAPVTATTPATTTRRKRKAKGWFCPVCRQPYTSLLRITTAPPPAAGSALPLSPTSPANASANPSANGNSGAGGEEDAGATTTGGGGLLGGLSGLRPAFLRGLSRAGPPRDVEAQ